MPQNKPRAFTKKEKMSRIEFNTSAELASLAENETIRVYEESRQLFSEEYQGDLDFEFYIASQDCDSEDEEIEARKSVLLDFSKRNAETVFMHYPEVIFGFRNLNLHRVK